MSIIKNQLADALEAFDAHCTAHLARIEQNIARSNQRLSTYLMQPRDGMGGETGPLSRERILAYIANGPVLVERMRLNFAEARAKIIHLYDPLFAAEEEMAAGIISMDELAARVEMQVEKIMQQLSAVPN